MSELKNTLRDALSLTLTLSDVPLGADVPAGEIYIYPPRTTTRAEKSQMLRGSPFLFPHYGAHTQQNLSCSIYHINGTFLLRAVGK